MRQVFLRQIQVRQQLVGAFLVLSRKCFRNAPSGPQMMLADNYKHLQPFWRHLNAEAFVGHHRSHILGGVANIDLDLS